MATGAPRSTRDDGGLPIRNTPTKPRPQSFADDETVILLVGDKAEPYRLLKNVAFTTCPYLAELPINEDGTIRLRNVDPSGFVVVVRWMYDGKIQDLLSVVTIRAFVGYAAAGTLKMHDLQNHILDVAWRGLAMQPSSFFRLITCGEILARGLADTPAYTMAVRSSVFALMTNVLTADHWAAELLGIEKNPQTMKDILIYIHRWNIQPWARPGDDDRCDFHIHPDGVRCPPSDSIRLGSGPGAAPPDEENGQSSTTNTGTTGAPSQVLQTKRTSKEPRVPQRLTGRKLRIDGPKS